MIRTVLGENITNKMESCQGNFSRTQQITRGGAPGVMRILFTNLIQNGIRWGTRLYPPRRAVAIRSWVNNTPLTYLSRVNDGSQPKSALQEKSEPQGPVLQEQTMQSTAVRRKTTSGQSQNGLSIEGIRNTVQRGQTTLRFSKSGSVRRT
jgi:hypothetical protein